MAKVNKKEADNRAASSTNKAWYYRWVDGTLQRISNLPKYKDGYSYFRIELDGDGIPVSGSMLGEDAFEGTVQSRLNEQNKKARIEKEKQQQGQSGQGVGEGENQNL
jgi:hypothetical protein